MTSPILTKAKVVGLSDKQIDSLIKMSEETQRQLMLKLDSLLKPNDEYELELLIAKEEYDKKVEVIKSKQEKFLITVTDEKEKIESELQEQSGMIELLTRFKVHEGPKEIKVYKQMSNATHQVGSAKQKRELRFADAAVEVLEKEDRFLTPDALYEKILFYNPGWKEKVSKLASAASHKFKTCQNLIRSAELGGNRKRGVQGLGIYKEKLGLFSWLLDDGEPEPKYMKDFLFQGEKK